MSGAELDRRDQEAANAEGTENRPSELIPDIGAHIRRQWTIFRDHRNKGQNALNERLLRAQRTFDRKYDPEKLAQIERFGGSVVYSGLTASKARGAASLLREVYLGADRPWDIQPQPDPPVPPDVLSSIDQLVQTEQQTQQQAGQPVMDDQLHMRRIELIHAAEQAARRNAMLQASAAADKIDDILNDGGFYEALGAFLTDLPLFPYAIMHGPVVRLVPKIDWSTGKAVIRTKPVMFWERVSSFDLYWTPGASDVADADVLRRRRFSRSDLSDLIGLPGYDEAALRGVLQDYAHGLHEWLDAPDPEQALNEGREDPNFNMSELIDGIEFSGNIQGRLLIDQVGIDPAKIDDPDRDYNVQSWVIGRYVIKTQLNPSPRRRHLYYITSFEKVPGTIAGHGLADILEDIQEVCNATMRSLVNNLAISSGPQVVVNDDMLVPTENGDEMYPWKRWHVGAGLGLGGAGAVQQAPITFFQPNSNAQELLTVYQSFMTMADEMSAIPRYMTGSGVSSGAGRTASGLSMLMGNAEKILQTVASNIDRDVLQPLLMQLYDMIMLTDTSGILTGQEQVTIRGVGVALQKETERQKQLQFLQITANPIDAPIVGEVGRARVLRAIASGLGLPDDVVPDDQTLQAKAAAQARLAQATAAAGPTNGAPGQTQPAGGPTPGAQAQGNQPPQATPARLADNAPPINLQQQGVPYHG